MLKIETLETTAERTTIRVSGDLTAGLLPELARLLDRARAARLAVRLDLSGLTRADRESVAYLSARRDLALVDAPAWIASSCAAERRSKKRGAAVAFLLVVLAGSARAQETGTLSISLRDAVRLALTQGTAVPIATARAEEARTLVAQARSALGPQLSASLGYQNNVLNLEAFGLPMPNPVVGPFDVYDAHLTAAMNLLDMAARRRVEAARSGVLASDADRRRVENEIAAAVATLYVGLQKAQANVEARAANLDLFGKLSKLAEDQRKAGTADRLDTSRAAVRVSRERQALLFAESQRDALRVALLHAIGEDQGRPLSLTEPLGTDRAALPAPVDAVSAARSARPDLAALEERVKGAELRVRAEEAERLPTFGVQFQGGWNGSAMTRLFFNRQIAGVLSVPLFTAGRTSAREAEARARLTEAKLQRDELGRQVEEEVRRALLTLASARSRVEVSEESLRLAQEELDVARDRYTNGVSPSIDVDNAAAALEGALSERIAAQADAAQARIDLLRATGGIRDVMEPSEGKR